MGKIAQTWYDIEFTPQNHFPTSQTDVQELGCYEDGDIYDA